MKLTQEGNYYRFWYGDNDEIKGGLVFSPDCINLTDKVKVMDNAFVGEKAWLSGNAVIKDNAVIEHKVHIGQNCIVGGNARLKGKILIGRGDDNREPMLYITTLDIEVSHDLCLSIYRINWNTAKDTSQNNISNAIRYDSNVSYSLIEEAVTIAKKAEKNGVTKIKIWLCHDTEELTRMRKEGWKIKQGCVSSMEKSLTTWLKSSNLFRNYD